MIYYVECLVYRVVSNPCPYVCICLYAAILCNPPECASVLWISMLRFQVVFPFKFSKDRMGGQYISITSANTSQSMSLRTLNLSLNYSHVVFTHAIFKLPRAYRLQRRRLLYSPIRIFKRNSMLQLNPSDISCLDTICVCRAFCYIELLFEFCCVISCMPSCPFGSISLWRSTLLIRVLAKER